MKKAKITGAIAPVPCPKCGANKWSYFRSYTTSMQVEAPAGSKPSLDVPINLMECQACKFIQGYALFLRYSFADGRLTLETRWIPMALAMMKKR